MGHRSVLTFLWQVASRVASLWPARVDRRQRIDAGFKRQARFLGLSMSDSLRDRLRPAWLRLRKDGRHTRRDGEAGAGRSE